MLRAYTLAGKYVFLQTRISGCYDLGIEANGVFFGLSERVRIVTMYNSTQVGIGNSVAVSGVGTMTNLRATPVYPDLETTEKRREALRLILYQHS